MGFFSLMFSSAYDRWSLVVMAVGLAANAAVDWSRSRRTPR